MKTKKRTIKLRFKFVLLACFLVYAGISIFSQQSNIGALQARNEALCEQYEQACTQLQRLEHKSVYMGTDQYIENEAREKFGFVYDDEIILQPDQDTQ